MTIALDDRPDLVFEPDIEQPAQLVTLPLSIWARLSGNDGLRKLAVVGLLLIVWETYGRWTADELVFPTFSATILAFVDAAARGSLVEQFLNSLRVLLVGYAIGVVGATALTVMAVTTRFGTDLLETLTAAFSPLPAIALLPLALLWFGLGPGSLLFVLVHSVL